ncbi:GFA family protein [Klebsiella pneumoniae]|uniref:GFA family protein n=1 Tax=Klebsiella pneumoniae TaxID=573 RepID=UPI003463C73E
MNGSCLCGTIEFELTHKPAVFYRCHCSLCRKQSGVGYNLATLVKDSEFRWIKGENCIASWSKPTGYRTDFCNVCGSTVPNSLRDVPYVWVPVGLIDERLEMECAGDFCTDDAMPWDETRSPREGANKQVISSQADSLIKISRIWADFFPANTSNQPI